MKNFTVLPTDLADRDLLILKFNTLLIILSNDWKCKHLRISVWTLGQGEKFRGLNLARYKTSWFLQVKKLPQVGIDTLAQQSTECQLQFFFFFSLIFSGYKCGSQLSWSNDSSPPAFSCVWRGWIYSVQLWRLHHFCLMCSGSFKESYIVPPLLLFFTCTLGVLFSQFSVIDYFVFYFVERNHWKNCSLLIVIFHVEYKISFIISVVTTPIRMKSPCTLYFATFSESPCLPTPCWRQSSV